MAGRLGASRGRRPAGRRAAESWPAGRPAPVRRRPRRCAAGRPARGSGSPLSFATSPTATTVETSPASASDRPARRRRGSGSARVAGDRWTAGDSPALAVGRCPGAWPCRPRPARAGAVAVVEVRRLVADPVGELDDRTLPERPPPGAGVGDQGAPREDVHRGGRGALAELLRRHPGGRAHQPAGGGGGRVEHPGGAEAHHAARGGDLVAEHPQERRVAGELRAEHLDRHGRPVAAPAEKHGAPPAAEASQDLVRPIRSGSAGPPRAFWR